MQKNIYEGRDNLNFSTFTLHSVTLPSPVKTWIQKRQGMGRENIYA